MKTKKQIRSFILKTLLPYKEDSSTCAFENKSCKYLDSKGRKCAVGRWMKVGVWQKYQKTITRLVDDHKLEDILLKPALDMSFSTKEWCKIQEYHDSISTDEGCFTINRKVEELESLFGIKLPELQKI